MTPIGTVGTADRRAARSVVGARTTAARAARSSSTPETNGNMMRKRPVRRRAQQRAQLRLEDVVEGEAEADAAQAERGRVAVDPGDVEPSCVSLTSNVRTVTRPGAMLSTSRR